MGETIGGAEVTDPAGALARFWVRAPEEDEGDVMAYRPHGWDLPPARGREGLELRTDGTAVVYEIAPGDGLCETGGRWRTDGTSLDVEIDDGRGRWLEIIEADETVLKVRRRTRA